MSEENFRIVVAAAVLIASLAFVVQAGIVLALFRLTRKMQGKTAGLMERVEPVLAKVEPVIDRVGPVIERIGPAIDSINAAVAKIGPAIDRFLPVADKAVIVVERAGVLVQSVNQATLSANQIMQDARPHIADITAETAAIVHSGREQVERLGTLLHDAGDRARARLEQIDHSVTATVEQIENVSGAVKSAVLRPVREVNGIAAGISAAVSTLMHGQHKSRVDSATQDEEMFI
jgi:ABC-type transporter Mla subunit MlaD